MADVTPLIVTASGQPRPYSVAAGDNLVGGAGGSLQTYTPTGTWTTNTTYTGYYL